MTYSYQELQNKLKKIYEDQLKTIKDNMYKIIYDVEKGIGVWDEQVKMLRDLENERKRIEAEAILLT